MAVISSLANTSLAIRYKDGVDAAGKDVIKAKKYSNVKVNAVNQDLYDTAAALSSLMRYPGAQILRNDDTVLINA
jgi:hypothetical protein